MRARHLWIVAVALTFACAWWLVRPGSPSGASAALRDDRTTASDEARETVALEQPAVERIAPAESDSPPVVETAIAPQEASAPERAETVQVDAADAREAIEPIRIAVRLLVVDAEAVSSRLRAETWVSDFERLHVIATRDPIAEVLPADARRPGSGYGVGQVAYRRVGADRKLASDLVPTAPSFVDAEDALPSDCVATIHIAEPEELYVHLFVGCVVLQTQRVPAAGTEVLFTISARDLDGVHGSATVRVVHTETGRAFEGASVALRPAAGERASALTDARGEAHFERVHTGWVELSIAAEDCAPISERVLVLPRRANDLGTWRLAAPAEIRGRILGVEGPCGSASVRGLPLDAVEAEHFVLPARAQSDAESGAFVLSGLRRGRTLVLAESGACAARPLIVDTTNGSVTDVEIRLERSTEIELTFDDRFTWGSFASLVDEDETMVFGAWLQGLRTWPVELLPGRYRARVVDRGLRLADREIEIGRDHRVVRVTR